MTNIRNKSVLVVEDDARMLGALDKVLTSEGMEVTSVAWAGDAIGILTEREKPIYLVITDLRMPFISGMTAVYAIHNILPKLPIIVLTAFGSPDVRAECFRQGAAAFLEKPLDTQKLLDAISNALSTQKNELMVIAKGNNPTEETSGDENSRKKIQSKKTIHVYERGK